MIIVALGANLASVAGPPDATIRAALVALGERGIVVRNVSHFWRTPAWPEPVDPPFINAAVIVATALVPKRLLEELHEVETQFGRDRSVQKKRNAPRTLDLDLIDYNGRVQAGSPELPHPRLQDRAFVLLPLRDVAPDWRHPVSAKSVDELIAALPMSAIERVSRLA